jgi:hypothetical protein
MLKADPEKKSAGVWALTLVLRFYTAVDVVHAIESLFMEIIKQVSVVFICFNLSKACQEGSVRVM